MMKLIEIDYLLRGRLISVNLFLQLEQQSGNEFSVFATDYTTLVNSYPVSIFTLRILPTGVVNDHMSK